MFVAQLCPTKRPGHDLPPAIYPIWQIVNYLAAVSELAKRCSNQGGLRRNGGGKIDDRRGTEFAKYRSDVVHQIRGWRLGRGKEIDRGAARPVVGCPAGQAEREAHLAHGRDPEMG